jgi:G3E family GTPase
MSRLTLTLTNDERFLLNHYTNIYNEQLKSIDLMYNELKETRDIIDYITRVDERPRRNTTNNFSPDTLRNIERAPESNTNTNTNTNTNRNARSTAVYRWDYYIPIDDLMDVVISPTQQEITNNTRQVMYNQVISPLNSSCPITLERFEDNTECTQIIGCGHLFNRDGLHQWLRENVRCPICRYDIRNINDNDNSETPVSDSSFNTLSDQLFNSLFRRTGVNRVNRRHNPIHEQNSIREIMRRDTST